MMGRQSPTYFDKRIDGYQKSINFHKGTTTSRGQAEQKRKDTP